MHGDTIKQEAERLLQEFGGNKENTIKCVEEIISATQKTTTYNHTGGMAFVGSTARSKTKYLKDPYWVAVKSYLNRNK